MKVFLRGGPPISSPSSGVTSASRRSAERSETRQDSTARVSSPAIATPGAAAANSGWIDAAGDRCDQRLRRYIALRLATAGAGGVHVAALQLSAGDRDAAIDALASGLDRLPDGPVGDAAIELVATWVDRDSELAPAIAARLAPELAGALALRTRHIAGDHRLARALSERSGQVS